MSGWKDISTAPMDGTVVEIGWLTEDHLEYSVEASWRFIQWRDPLGDDRALFINPTHWRPINARASGWQPIETAPKDGTWIWAYIPTKVIPRSSNTFYRYGQRYIAVHWVTAPPDTKAKQVSKRSRDLDEMLGGYWSPKINGHRPTHACPTHWMPLPPRPEGEP